MVADHQRTDRKRFLVPNAPVPLAQKQQVSPSVAGRLDFPFFQAASHIFPLLPLVFCSVAVCPSVSAIASLSSLLSCFPSTTQTIAVHHGSHRH